MIKKLSSLMSVEFYLYFLVNIHQFTPGMASVNC